MRKRVTRINCIDPALLSDKHLIAEYRELPRVFTLSKAAQQRGEAPDDKRNPEQYCLGSGHVRFFYSRLIFLKKRQENLIAECLNRGFNIQYTDTSGMLAGMDQRFLQDWQPTEIDKQLNIERIHERGGLRAED